MKTLFAKILVWFLATTAAALLGLVALGWYLGSGLIAQQQLLRALRFHSREAVHNYEEGGGEQLAQFLERLQAAYDFRGVLAEERGRVLSGPPEEARMKGVTRNPRGSVSEPTMFRNCRRSVNAGPHSGCRS